MYTYGVYVVQQMLNKVTDAMFEEKIERGAVNKNLISQLTLISGCFPDF